MKRRIRELVYALEAAAVSAEMNGTPGNDEEIKLETARATLFRALASLGITPEMEEK